MREINTHSVPAIFVRSLLGAMLLLLCAVSAAAAQDYHRRSPAVLLDCFYNNEWKSDAAGTRVRYHYVWSDTANSGFSILGKIIAGEGALVDTLCAAPSRERLARSSVYLIVDPDTPLESPEPNYIQPADITVITDWVREGGVLVLMGNDRGNAEFVHLNMLASAFGITFNEDSRNKVTGTNYAAGTFNRFPDHPLFAGVRRVFLKELSTLGVAKGAVPLFSEGGDVIMAFANYGRGHVFAVGDPWFYNEYMDRRRLPDGYDNPKAAENLFRWLLALAAEKDTLVVAPDGSGDFQTIQSALDAVPPGNTNNVTIFIRKGTYAEKVYITRSHVTLLGEQRDSTRIVFAELRENWNRDHQGSDRGSGVVNIDTGITDVTIANLTIYNNYGALYGTTKHQFAIRGAGTRIMLLGCNVIADGGDTVSLWDRNDGMYYHAECYFEGWVDYVCPRGWCYITSSRFFGHNTPSASIWHDGSGDRDQKFVIRDSYFDGVPGFPLGRNHLDGAIYLIGCSFSKNMTDRPFYRPPSSPREWQWGDRHYFFGCHRDSADFSWLKDNLNSAEGAPDPDRIDARWTFGGRWDPEPSMPSILPYPFLPSPRNGARRISAAGVRLTWVASRGAQKHTVFFGRTNPPELKRTLDSPRFDTGPLEPHTTYYWRVEEPGGAGGTTWGFTTE